MKENRIDRYIREYGEDLIVKTFNESKTRTEFLEKLGFKYSNGTTSRFTSECISRFGLSSEHFDLYHKSRKYTTVTKECPICGTEFEAKDGEPREKTTCSYGCANILFRSGEDNGRHKKGKGTTASSSYRYICFKYHDKKCIICGEDKVITVHHYDEDHYNNSPENLVPMCPTHHQYMHSRHKHLISDQVDEYIKNLKII